MAHIHWYPGHIAKAQRQLKEKLNLVDVIIEVIDARIPYSSRYPSTDKLCPNKPRLILMNKADLADEKYNKIWKNIISDITQCDCVLTDFKKAEDINKIISKVIFLSDDIMQKRAQKGLLARAVRTMVIGMPNVGKSSTINRLVKHSKTKTGAKAGVTRTQQWVRINDKIELLDTPGIIPTTQDDQNVALKLAFVNSVGENAYDSEYVAQKLLETLSKNYKTELLNYFKLSDDEQLSLENIAIKKCWLQKGSNPDTLRASEIILSAFRDAKLGRITLETPEEYGFI